MFIEIVLAGLLILCMLISMAALSSPHHRRRHRHRHRHG
ncbi:hypothetical protein FHR83_001479 [Actinoplanes campanulatus]|uniref:Uncharacterized protein n=1 Tax=Actinoplanes campanulatus TaxID=113559 RepID=A0A7W5AD67_9ACTN|nr:hypothetical protein [Actinoplanes campanulatus]